MRDVRMPDLRSQRMSGFTNRHPDSVESSAASGRFDVSLLDDLVHHLERDVLLLLVDLDARGLPG